MNLGNWDIYLEIFVFILTLFAIFYIFDSSKRVNNKISPAMLLLFFGYLSFMFTELLRIFSFYVFIENVEVYKLALRLVTMILVAMGLFKFNICIKEVHAKKKKKPHFKN